MKKCYYEIFGLSEEATNQQLKNVYRDLSKIYITKIMLKCIKCYKENVSYYRPDFNFFYDGYYRPFLGSFLCDDCWEMKQSLMKQLELIHQREMKELELIHRQALKGTIQERLEIKQNEQNQLKNVIGSKLEDGQKYLLESLLERQEDFDLVVFDEDVNQTGRTFLRTQDKLQEVKNKLIKKLSVEEVEEFCKTQTEISKLEELTRNSINPTKTKKEQEQEKFVRQVENIMKQVQELEQKRENLAKTVDIYKKIYANQKTTNALHRKELTQRQVYIRELEFEKATNYGNFMDEYGKTMESFYKRQGINTGDYKEHLQDYIFSKKLQAENEQLRNEINDLKKELVNSKLETKIEIFPNKKL